MQEPEPGLIAEAVAKGAEFLRRGVTDYAKWSTVMRYTFGESVAPHLERVWAASRERVQNEPVTNSDTHAPDIFNELTVLRDELSRSSPSLPRKIIGTIGRQLTNLILLLIAYLLFLIWQRMPPTVGDYRAGKDPKALYLKQPMIRAGIEGSVDVNIENEPLEVKIKSGNVTLDESPIDVRIVR